MVRHFRTYGAGAAAMLLLAGCVPSTSADAPTPPAAPPARPATVSSAGLAGVIGRSAQFLEAQFGKPDLDVREGTARKLQYIGQACVLDAYLYPPRGGGVQVVTYVDARLPDGRDTDKAGCVASLSRSRQAR